MTYARNAYVGYEACGCATYFAVDNENTLQRNASNRRAFAKRGGQLVHMTMDEAREVIATVSLARHPAGPCKELGS